MLTTICIIVIFSVLAFLLIWGLLQAINDFGGSLSGPKPGDYVTFDEPLPISSEHSVVGGQVIAVSVDHTECLIDLMPIPDQIPLGFSGRIQWFFDVSDINETVENLEEFKKYKVVDGHIVKCVDAVA